MLIALGFGLGLVMAPVSADSSTCVGAGSSGAAISCPGTYQILGNPEKNVDVKYLRTNQWYTGDVLYHSVTVKAFKTSD